MRKMIMTEKSIQFLTVSRAQFMTEKRDQFLTELGPNCMNRR